MKFMLFRHGVIADVSFAEVSLLFFYTHISNLPICCQVSSCLLSLLNLSFPGCFLLLITYLLFLFLLVYSLSLLFFFYLFLHLLSSTSLHFIISHSLSHRLIPFSSHPFLSLLSLPFPSSLFFPSRLFSSLLFLLLSHIASSDSLASDIHIRYPRPRYDKYVNFLY